MTSSDDDLSWVLRRELNAEAARLAAAQDGLSQIRAQLRSRPSVPVWGPLWGGLRVDAERYGLRARHLAAEAADWIVGVTGRIPFPGRRDHAEGRAGAQPGLVWLRPVLAVAAVCIFAGTAAAVPGLRHAITNIGSSGSGHTASVTGPGGGSGLGTAQRQNGGHSGPGGQAGATTSATPSPSATCTALAKPLPKAKASPASSGGAVSPTVTPAQSSPAATPTTEPASPTQAPTSPTGSSGPTPTDTSGAPLQGGGSGPPVDSAHLSKVGTCVGPTLKGSAAAAGASQIPTEIPTPLQTRAQVERPAVTPATSATSAPATPAGTAGRSDSATPSATSTTSSSGSPWSQGFETARACRHHPHPGCPGA
ncbi:MAG TPA: hypothetical protein VH089_00960 [Streptosporangiaceae bacterium]|nr:hypothetical protein [Streptosporangiaceae bacterium]